MSIAALLGVVYKNDFHPLRKKTTTMASPNASTLSSSIVATLKGRIIAWRYPPEHRLTEDGLCREFGVSRSPVREALRVLATNGFIRRMDNRGYAVRQVRLSELEELYDVRLALELFAVETLATSSPPADALAELAEVWRGVGRRPKRTVEELAKLDAQFHERLASLIKNETLLQQLKAIDERLFVFRMIDFEAADRVKNTCVAASRHFGSHRGERRRGGARGHAPKRN